MGWGRGPSRGGPKVDGAGLIAARPWAPGPESSGVCVLCFPSGVRVEHWAGPREVARWYSALGDRGGREVLPRCGRRGRKAAGRGGTGGTEAGSCGSRGSPLRRPVTLEGEAREGELVQAAGLEESGGLPCCSAACIRVLSVQSPSGSQLWSCIILGQVPVPVPNAEDFVVLQDLSSRLRRIYHFH